jgi:predicted MFS family arabinose efflux permease
MPPVLNIIALATFAASLSARALDPVLPHVADEFGVSIATAASFSSVFAFTFAIASFDMQQLSSLKNLASYLSIHSNFQIFNHIVFIFHFNFLNAILYVPIARRPRLLKREVL